MGGKQIKPGGEPRQPEASLLEGMAAGGQEVSSLWESAAAFHKSWSRGEKKKGKEPQMQ